MQKQAASQNHWFQTKYETTLGVCQDLHNAFTANSSSNRNNAFFGKISQLEVKVNFTEK